MGSATYKSAGVDIDKANEFVKAIRSSVASTSQPGMLVRKGAFAGLFALDLKGLTEPVLVSSTDGVGTKLLIANAVNRHDTVGIDLVAMNVNDILCTGARPLFFLDYIACGKVDPVVLKKVIKGIATGCRQAGCCLIGGETAEMPGLYKLKDYDLAGFTVGVVEKSKIIDGSAVREGDAVIGLASSGLHSNGYSLARKVLSKPQHKSMAAELLRPTKIYVKDVLAVLEKFEVRGMAHNTGGAYYEKLTKILPDGLCLSLRRSTWLVPKIFQIIQKQGKISDPEMCRTFNMGIGFILVVPASQTAEIRTFLSQRQVRAYQIGSIIKNNKTKIQFIG